MRSKPIRRSRPGTVAKAVDRAAVGIDAGFFDA